MIGLAAWAPTAVAVITAIFIAGQITGRIKNQEQTLKDHHERFDDHEAKFDSLGNRVDSLGNRMTAAEAWREGYNAASKTK